MLGALMLGALMKSSLVSALANFGPRPHASEQAHHQEQDHRTDEGDDQTPQGKAGKSAGKAENAGKQVREHQATKEGAEDAHDDVAE